MHSTMKKVDELRARNCRIFPPAGWILRPGVSFLLRSSRDALVTFVANLATTSDALSMRIYEVSFYRSAVNLRYQMSFPARRRS